LEKSDAGSQTVCRQYCRMSSSTDCPSGQKCQSYYASVGVCR
jgi:hypothetical protein